MKSRTVASMIGIAAFVVLAAGIRLAANAQPDPGIQPHYKVADLGTLGGSFAAANSLNNLNVASGVSNLAGNTIARARYGSADFKFDLGTLGGPNSNSAVLWPVKNVRGLIVGISETSKPERAGRVFFLRSLYSAHRRYLPGIYVEGSRDDGAADTRR